MRWIAIALLTMSAACGSKETRTVVRMLQGPDTGGGWKEIVARFEAAHPEIDIEIEQGPDSTDAREAMYIRSFMSGDGVYDVVYMDVIWVPKFAAQGWLMPLEDRLPPAGQEAFLPGDIRGSIYEGRLYRIPMASDAGMLYYRTDLVPNPPRTFDELVQTARNVQKPPELWGFVFQGQQYEGLVCDFLEILWGHGGDVLNEKGEVLLDAPEAVRALEWMKSLVKDISPEGVTTYEEEQSRAVFHQGRAAFMRNWPYAWTLAQQEASPIRGKVGIVPMVHAPGKSSAATLGGWGFGIAKTTRHADAAWKFIEFATRAENQKIVHLKNGMIPTRHGLFDDPDVLRESPHYSELYKVLLAARPRPVHPQYSEISAALQTHLSAALIGKETPKDALAQAASRIRAVLKK